MATEIPGKAEYDQLTPREKACLEDARLTIAWNAFTRCWPYEVNRTLREALFTAVRAAVELQASRDTERLDVAQELLMDEDQGSGGPHSFEVAGLRLPKGVQLVWNLRALLDAVIAKRDGTEVKP